MINILIVEDELPIANLLRMTLTRAGYSCTCATDGNQAAELLANHLYDLVLLDVMLPGINGFDLLADVRAQGAPAIFLTAKSSVEDRVKGLRLGADDYIVKPFSVLELQARVETVLRRTNKLDRLLTVGDLVIDTQSMLATRNGETISLTAKEYDLLVLFARNPGIVLSKELIYERVWGGLYPEHTRTVELHIQRMKKKVGWENRLRPVYGLGYRLEAMP